MSKQLHKHIGVILFRINQTSKMGRGTGILISPDLVLTCAHNIYNKFSGELHREIKFYHGQCGVMEKHCEIDDFFFPGKFHLNPIISHDYALLKLK